jgi:hypothetical protein
MPHATAGIYLNTVASRTHNVGAMTKQTSGKTGRKRNANIKHFNIDPTSLIDDNARQHNPKENSLGTINKPDAIGIGVGQPNKQTFPLEARMEEVISALSEGHAPSFSRYVHVQQCSLALYCLPQNLVWVQNVLSQIATQTMRITKHCTEGLTFHTCLKCVRLWCIMYN